ncbi:MAG TPA: peptidase S41, partial [Candidatus Atribacteria bacterium]|nr:peptidase S41 [Candidatus Atribacteria bacterium]
CEIEAYGFSQVPGMYVIGETPTAGMEGEVARGQYKLPDDMMIIVPTGRYTMPDGSLLIEGEGVQPNQDVPVTRDGVLSGQDTVLYAAIDYILE